MGRRMPATDFTILSIHDQLEQVEDGVPLGHALHILASISPADTALVRRFIPRSSARRVTKAKSSDAKLNRAASEKIARLERIWFRVCSIYQNDTRAAGDFLLRPHAMLQGRAPIDLVVAGETATAFLSQVLSTIEFGYAV